jgi:hypothetical protein
MRPGRAESARCSVPYCQGRLQPWNTGVKLCRKTRTITWPRRARSSSSAEIATGKASRSCRRAQAARRQYAPRYERGDPSGHEFKPGPLTGTGPTHPCGRSGGASRRVTLVSPAASTASLVGSASRGTLYVPAAQLATEAAATRTKIVSALCIPIYCLFELAAVQAADVLVGRSRRVHDGAKGALSAARGVEYSVYVVLCAILVGQIPGSLYGD